MTDAPQPRSGQLYRTAEGEALVFVRTEQRPGVTAPEHLLLRVGDRIVFERWLPVGDPLPDDLELIHDPDATAHAEAAGRELERARAERAALLRVIRKALPMVPVVTANAMRAAYREAIR